jgi:branched-chain amino acid transport system permease protein
LRLRGDYFAIATLGFEEVVRITLNANPFESLNPNAKTKLVLLPSVDVFGVQLISGTAGELALVGILFAAVFLLCIRLIYSPFGRLLRASRDDELGTMSLGKDVFHLRIKAFMFSAALGSLAGSLYVHHFRTFAPDQFALMLTIMILLTVILGGAGSSVGTMIGVIVIKILVESPFWLVGWAIENNLMTIDQASAIDIGGVNLLIFAALVIVTMLLFPYGILGEGSLLGSLVEKIRLRVFAVLSGRRRAPPPAPVPVVVAPPPGVLPSPERQAGPPAPESPPTNAPPPPPPPPSPAREPPAHPPDDDLLPPPKFNEGVMR